MEGGKRIEKKGEKKRRKKREKKGNLEKEKFNPQRETRGRGMTGERPARGCSRIHIGNIHPLNYTRGVLRSAVVNRGREIFPLSSLFSPPSATPLGPFSLYLENSGSRVNTKLPKIIFHPPRRATPPPVPLPLPLPLLPPAALPLFLPLCPEISVL